jgi:hypothetical protein
MGPGVSAPSDLAIDLTGPFNAQVTLNGTIKNLVHISGDCTTTSSLVLARQQLIDAGGIIIDGEMRGVIEVGGDKMAPITINQGLTGTLTVHGNADDTITLVQGLRAGGRIRIDGDLVTNGTSTPGTIICQAGPMAGTISIGGSLKGAIQVPASTGLSGQIIINANNSSPAGTWTNDVKVGTFAVPHGTYSTLSSSLGGGAVGLVPFRLYANDCAPKHNTLIPAPHMAPKITKVTTDFNTGGGTPPFRSSSASTALSHSETREPGTTP